MVQKSKTPAAQDVSRVLTGGICKWNQLVLSEMSSGVYKGRAFNNKSRSSTPKPNEGDLRMERERGALALLVTLNLNLYASIWMMSLTANPRR